VKYKFGYSFDYKSYDNRDCERPWHKRRDNIKIAVTEMRCNVVDETKLNCYRAAGDTLFSVNGKVNIYIYM